MVSKVPIVGDITKVTVISEDNVWFDLIVLHIKNTCQTILGVSPDTF